MLFRSLTIGAVLGTVTDAATAVSTVIGTGIKGVNMLDQYVTDAAEKQKIRSIVDMESFETRLIEEVSMEDTQRQLKTLEFISKDEKTAELYEKNHNRIANLLQARKTK